MLKRLPIHRAQYALVGLALATFFLLLIALSEHIAFGLAYLIAAGACIALLGFYLAPSSSVRAGARHLPQSSRCCTVRCTACSCRRTALSCSARRSCSH